MFAFLLCLISVVRQVFAGLKALSLNDNSEDMAETEKLRNNVTNVAHENATDDGNIVVVTNQNFKNDLGVERDTPSTPDHAKRVRRASDVIDSIGDRESAPPGHSTPQQAKPMHLDLISPDQGYGATPGQETDLVPRWMTRRTDDIDATPPNVSNGAQPTSSTPVGLTAAMPVAIDSDRYNMNHPNRGKCLVFNHEVFDTGFSRREGSTVDAKRINATFTKLGFEVIVHDNLEHYDVIDAIKKLSSEDHTNNDCVCIFVLTHGLNNDMILAKDAAYKSDKIWKPFTADNCPTLAGKPKLFFFQACRGDKLDGGITLMPRSGYTQTDSAIASYKIPTHADFLIAHSSVEGFFSWRNPEEGTWYVQCLCSVLEQHAADMDLIQILTMTARKVAIDHESYDDMNSQKNEQKQVPSTTSMLIRSVYFTPK